MKAPITPAAIAPVWLLLFEMAAMDEGLMFEEWISEVEEVGVNDDDDVAIDLIRDDNAIGVDEAKLSNVVLDGKEPLEMLTAP